MVKEHEIAYNTIHDYLKKESFTFDELQEEIIKRGGIQRVGIGYSVGEYIMGLEEEEEGTIQFDPKKKVFVPQKENSLEDKTKQ